LCYIKGVTATVTWIGHATAVIDLHGERILIDPLGRRRCGAVEDYRAVLITHSHVDHLNRWTLSRLERDVTLVVPKGAAPIIADLGFRDVLEAEAGDQIPIGSLEVTAVPTKHDHGRWRRGDTPVAIGYIVESNGIVVHHAGDIDMSDHAVFEDLGRDFAIDATLLPIGGMLPVWYYRWRRKALDRGVHIDPDTALSIAESMGARRMVPVHWGTVNLRFGPPSAPRSRLQKVADEREASSLVRVLSHGESLDLKVPDDT